MPVAVLFVDDDLDLREAMRELFSLLEGVSVVLASNLGDVEAQPAALACGLAIVDINLGAGQPSGLDVARWLERHGFRGNVVFLTGHGRGDPRVAAAAQVAHAQLMSKPLKVEELVHLVDEARARP